MTFHAESRRAPATGGQTPGGADQPASPRVACSFDADTFGHLAALAHQQAVPIAALIRRAVAAWLRAINDKPAKVNDSQSRRRTST
jgi:hypothetical protein